MIVLYQIEFLILEKSAKDIRKNRPAWFMLLIPFCFYHFLYGIIIAIEKKTLFSTTNVHALLYGYVENNS